MSHQPRNTAQIPGKSSFLEELYQGRFRWDLIHPFPVQDAADRAAGDEAVAGLRTLLAEWADQDTIEQTASLPAGLLADLRSSGHLRARLAPEQGGLGLSQTSTFRLVEALAGRSLPVAMVVAAENAFGVGALLPQLGAGPLRDFLADRVRAGAISAMADTEPDGASNLRRFTTAELTGDGYRLHGEKLFVSNAPVADHLIVSASVRQDGAEHRRLLVVDAASPGVRITPQTFMGLRGFPVGDIVFDDVRVPADRVVLAPADDTVRITAESAAMARMGRVFFTVAPSLAIARQSLAWSKDFVTARVVDGRPLREYDAIQRGIAESAADIFAVEAFGEWTLLGHDTPGLNTNFEQNSVKNVTGEAVWRVVERAMSTLAGEGYETAASKRARHCPRPHALERAMRDVLAFRIAGGVGFHLDNLFSRQFIFSYYYPPALEPGRCQDPGPVPELGERNVRHLRFVANEVSAFGRLCRKVSRRFPEPERLYHNEWLLILISRLARELCTAALVLARAARRAALGDRDAADLADVYCTAARHRMADLWQRIRFDGGPDHRRVATSLLGSTTRERSAHPLDRTEITTGG